MPFFCAPSEGLLSPREKDRILDFDAHTTAEAMKDEYRIVIKPEEKGFRVDSYQVKGNFLLYFETVGYAETLEKAKELVKSSKFYTKRRVAFEYPCAK